MTVRMHVERASDGTWSAWSREGAAAEMVSGTKAMLGRLTGKLPPHGALVNVEQGRLTRGGNDTLLVAGRLLSPITGNRYLTGTIVGGRLTAELRQDTLGPGGGPIAGSVDGAPLRDPARPLRDYAALGARVRQAFADSLYDPQLVDRPEWRGFFTE